MNTPRMTAVSSPDSIRVDVEFRNPVYTLGGTDAASFKIDDSGNLSFKNPPNYEVPTDDGVNNVYEVTVRIGAGGEDGAPDPGRRLSPGMT